MTSGQINQEKHGVSFAMAQLAFLDHHRVILEDLEHSDYEKRYYCLGTVSGGILTVRFTYRKNKICISTLVKLNPNFKIDVITCRACLKRRNC